VVPLQDLLELGDEARINTPGTVGGNWCWRLDRQVALLAGALQGFGAMAARYGRGVTAPSAGEGVGVATVLAATGDAAGG